MAWQTLLYDRDGHVGTVTVNRPDALNALNTTVFAELSELFSEIAVDPDVRVIVLKGAGEKSFVAGADIKEMTGMTRQQAEARSWTGMRLYDQMRRMPQPLVASIQGYALGGGMLIAMACDIRVASTAATFGYPEIRLGIFPGTGGTVLIDRLIGPAAARAICLLGDRFPAERAYQLGLVNRLVEPGLLVAETADVAATLAGYSPVAIRELKSVLNASLELDFATAREVEIDAYGRAFESEDRVEGTTAFVEKRKPDFKGR
ncbi:MAG: enoyl-CoA hydratase/isomerase family protein [Minwuia sp.]|uniref:enoyl-CoA hydratase/isomerase family protein n=1 Tax=Minwuia sp. TaxID=2493630 RepID=UPI003A8864DB